MSPYLVILGVAQDGGHPHAGCRRECCRAAFEGKEPGHRVSCLGLVDPPTGVRWLFDCTPDFPAQLRALNEQQRDGEDRGRMPLEHMGETPMPLAPDGIVLTHAHIGHYAGLMYLGREAMNALATPVYAAPDMAEFLRKNASWEQLVRLRNIELREVAPDAPLHLNERITVTAFRVPHRAEYSSTVGYRIAAPGASAIYIPDLDKWSKWDRDIAQVVRENDLLLVDGTFFSEGELPGRDAAEVPHPLVRETMETLATLEPSQRAKVHFIHLNHSNPALREGSDARNEITRAGFRLAQEGYLHPL